MSLFRRRAEGRFPEAMQLKEIDERHNLAQQVFFRREASGWSQEELASKACMTQAQIATIEAGHSNPTLRTLVKVAHALECEVQELLAAWPQAQAETPDMVLVADWPWGELGEVVVTSTQGELLTIHDECLEEYAPARYLVARYNPGHTVASEEQEPFLQQRVSAA